MHPIKKVFLYPLTVTAVIIFATSLNWLMTWFFSIIFNTSLEKIVASELAMFFYLVSYTGYLIMSILICEYIHEKL